jgi:sugar-specific transcriptional regulator TrmB
MPDFPRPEDPATAEEERDRWDEGLSVRDRVYETVVQLYEPATAAEVADRARCSEGAAREHLTWFTERGIVEAVEGRPKRYVRNQAYFDWKRANDLRREYTDAELGTRLEELTEQERAYRERYGVESPHEIDVTEAADYDALHDVWTAVSDWKTLRREMRLVERARKDREALADAPG